MNPCSPRHRDKGKEADEKRPYNVVMPKKEKEYWRYANVCGQLEGMDLVIEFFSRKSIVSGIPRTLRVRCVCGAVIRQLVIPLPTTTDYGSRA